MRSLSSEPKFKQRAFELAVGLFGRTFAQIVLDGVGDTSGYQTPSTLCGHELLRRLQATSR